VPVVVTGDQGCVYIDAVPVFEEQEHHKVEYGDFYIEKLNSKYIAGERGLSTI
jgi:hypothetical protein